MASRPRRSRLLQDLEFRQLVERVKLRSPVEVVVGERVSDLKKRGSLYWARCPFHEERTPSFAVDPRRGTWRCYGACAEGGDVLSFIERYDGLSFLDALRLLAQAAGEEVPETGLRKRSRAEDGRRERLLEVLERATKLYRHFLGEDTGKAARAYLEERGFDGATLERFAIGWAPPRGNPLLQAAQKAGFSLDVLVEAGLVKRDSSDAGPNGRAYDFFRGRLMVPIQDRLGRTVGFGARLLPSDEDAERPQAKYVNTPETPLFHKGRLIYGLNLAIDEVRKKRQLVLVEGYTDVMAAHQAERRQVAAVLGTATTEDHAALVRRTGARRVTLFFDGDDAGRKATMRALAGLLPLEVEIDVASPPAGSDPADLLLAPAGGAAFDGALEGATEWFDWALEGLSELTGAALAAAVDERFSLLARLGNSIERSKRLAELARGLQLPEDDVRVRWQAYSERRRRVPSVPTAAEPRDEAPDSAEEEAFGLLIGALLLDNSLIPLYADLEERCPGGELQTFFQALLHLHEETLDDDPIDSGRLMTHLADHPARERVLSLEERAMTADSAQSLARDQAHWLEKRQNEQELAQLRGRLSKNVELFEGDDATTNLLKDIHTRLRQGRVPLGSEPQPNP